MRIFRVLVPTEFIGIAKRIALLPAGITRIINGLAHLPADMMRAIAVLDAPAEIEEHEITSGEVITYKESSNTEKNGAAYQSAAGRIRTVDHPVNSRGLYQLSYSGPCENISKSF